MKQLHLPNKRSNDFLHFPKVIEAALCKFSGVPVLENHFGADINRTNEAKFEQIKLNRSIFFTLYFVAGGHDANFHCGGVRNLPQHPQHHKYIRVYPTCSAWQTAVLAGLGADHGLDQPLSARGELVDQHSHLLQQR